MKSSSNPLLTADDVGAEAWEDWILFAPKVILDGSTYKMWYAAGTGTTTADNDYQIGYATSSDGITWTRDTGNNPVLAPGGGVTWDADSVLESHVIKDGSTYKMWYQGARTSTGKSQIGYATSSDGITWTKDGGNPVVANGAGGSDDEDQASKPCVLKIGASDYRMWYCGKPSGGDFVVMYATSTDGIAWTKDSTTLTVSGEFCVYPYVINEDSVFKMIVQVGPNGGAYNLLEYISADGSTNWQLQGEYLTRGSNPAFDDFYLGGGHSIIDTGNGREIFYAGRDQATQEPTLTRRYNKIGQALRVEDVSSVSFDIV